MAEAGRRSAMNLNRLAYFAAVVDTGSFTRAAERLGITKAVVSQQVARLEEEVGATLLARTTRRVQPTEAGRRLYVHAIAIVHESAAAFDELAAGATTPHGTLRITAPFDYGTTVVVPVVAEFTRRYPGCDVELSLSDGAVPLDDLDLAIRVGWLRDSRRIARRIATFEQRLVCVPGLLGDRARLGDPDDVAALPFVGNAALARPLVWRFVCGGSQRTVRLRARLLVNTTPAAHAAALAGVGASVLPDYLVEADLVAGRLVHVLPDWRLTAGGIHAVFPAARFRPAKVTRFVEILGRLGARTAAGG
jgi:DNA-binding transcriptional LysR family regulator